MSMSIPCAMGILITAFSALSFAETGTKPTYCNQADVFTIERPLYPNQKHSKTFRYRYQLFKGGAVDSPVIVALPGGPGVASISANPASFPMVGPGFNIIYTDQRGSGCNILEGKEVSDQAYSTENFASDIIAIIKKENLKKYVLYGHSFGTVHATVTASLIEQARAHGEFINLPQALILEGIIGRYFKAGEALTAYQTSWNNVLDRLPEDVQVQLRKPLPPFSDLSEVSDRWGAFLFNQLYNGRFPEENVYARSFNLEWKLKLLASNNPSDIEKIKNEISNSQAEDYGYTFRVLGCNEVFTDYPSKFSLANGTLNGIGNYCDGLKITRPYDSKSWPNTIPVFYFEGTDDQATPLWQARYHVENQPSGKKHFILIEGASHMPLSYSLTAANCKKAVWDSLIDDGENLSVALQTCKWPWSISLDEK